LAFFSLAALFGAGTAAGAAFEEIAAAADATLDDTTAAADRV